MTPDEWINEYVHPNPDIRRLRNPHADEWLTVLVLGRHRDEDESYRSCDHHQLQLTEARQQT